MCPVLTDWLVVSPLLLLLLLLLLLAVLPFGTVDEEMGDELIWPSGWESIIVSSIIRSTPSPGTWTSPETFGRFPINNTYRVLWDFRVNEFLQSNIKSIWYDDAIVTYGWHGTFFKCQTIWCRSWITWHCGSPRSWSNLWCVILHCSLRARSKLSFSRRRYRRIF